MTNTDERREVARALREEAKINTYGYDYDNVWQLFLDPLIDTVNADGWGPVFARLADLIEPEGSGDECVVHCKDCGYLDTMWCPVKRALVYEGVSPTAVIAPGGLCAWGKPKECK